MTKHPSKGLTIFYLFYENISNIIINRYHFQLKRSITINTSEMICIHSDGEGG